MNVSNVRKIKFRLLHAFFDKITMDKFASDNSLAYQTIPPTTVMMAGNNKEGFPVGLNDRNFSFNSNVRNNQAAGGDPNMAPNFVGSSDNNVNGVLLSFNEASEVEQQNEVKNNPETNASRIIKPSSNVIVDDSPLQLQMEKNKECKYLIYIRHEIDNL